MPFEIRLLLKRELTLIELCLLVLFSVPMHFSSQLSFSWSKIISAAHLINFGDLILQNVKINRIKIPKIEIEETIRGE